MPPAPLPKWQKTQTKCQANHDRMSALYIYNIYTKRTRRPFKSFEENGSGLGNTIGLCQLVDFLWQCRLCYPHLRFRLVQLCLIQYTHA